MAEQQAENPPLEYYDLIKLTWQIFSQTCASTHQADTEPIDSEDCECVRLMSVSPVFTQFWSPPSTVDK